MRLFNIGLIRVLTTDDKDLLNIHGKILQGNFPFEVESRCIPDQSTGVYSEETHLKAVPKVLGLAIEMEKEGKEGIIISCAADPGIEEAKQVLGIPVVGAGTAVASIALGFSQKVGVLNLTESTPEAMKQVLSKYLIAEETVSTKNTLTLMTNEGMESIIKSSLKLKKSGVEVIALACTGMSTMNAASKIKDRIDVYVADPVIAEGMIMWNLLNF